MVTAVGNPRATSAAKLGPDRIAGTAIGAHSAMISVMNLCVPRSIPFAHAISGVCFVIDDASDTITERMACAGTTTRMASLPAVSLLRGEACFAGRLPQRLRDALQCVTRQGIMPGGTCLRHASRPLPAPVRATTAINSPSFQAKGCEEFSRRDGIQKKPKEIGICLQLKRAFLAKIQCGCMRGLVKGTLTSNSVGFNCCAKCT